MATAPKANPKVVPIDEAKGEAAPAPKKSRKKLMLIGGILLLAIGGGSSWYFMNSQEAAPGAPAKMEPPKPPVFLAMEPFTVNLQPEMGEQYLQVAFTLQVADQVQVENIKLYMPLVRSRILMLLSTKKASELSSAEGKKKLQDEIIAQIKQPFAPQSPPQQVSGVFFTSFVIQ
ncbi:MAG TPA: flagellar basal body-associated protein FliL [Noviherbaspirillum sp.]